MNENVRIAAAEAVGTAVLVIGGCGTALYAAHNPLTTVGFAGVATAFGLSLLIMAYTIGPISGCHINPAVTLGMVVAGKTKPAAAPYYVAGQLVGGLAGGFFLRIVFRLSDAGLSIMGNSFASNGYGAHSPAGYKLPSVIAVEIVLTALLVMVVLGTTHPKFVGGFGGLAVGATLWLIHLISIPVDNTSVNPARSLAVAPFAYDSWPMKQLWVFLLFPLVGGAIGALVWKFISGSDAGPEPTVETEPTLPTVATKMTLPDHSHE